MYLDQRWRALVSDAGYVNVPKEEALAAVASGNSKVLIQSDVTNIPEFFLRNPDWHVAYDVALAQTTRHKFYDLAATEKAMVVGFHFTFPRSAMSKRTAANTAWFRWRGIRLIGVH